MIKAVTPELQYDFIFGTILGLLIGLLPSLLLGALTGILLATFFKIRTSTSGTLNAMVGAAFAFFIAVAVHTLAFFTISNGDTIGERIDSLSLLELPAYYVFMGIPSIIYILAGAVAGRVIGALPSKV